MDRNFKNPFIGRTPTKDLPLLREARQVTSPIQKTVTEFLGFCESVPDEVRSKLRCFLDFALLWQIDGDCFKYCPTYTHYLETLLCAYEVEEAAYLDWDAGWRDHYRPTEEGLVILCGENAETNAATRTKIFYWGEEPPVCTGQELAQCFDCLDMIDVPRRTEHAPFQIMEGLKLMYMHEGLREDPRDNTWSQPMQGYGFDHPGKNEGLFNYRKWQFQQRLNQPILAPSESE